MKETKGIAKESSVTKDIIQDTFNKMNQIIEKCLIYPTFFNKDNEERTVKEIKEELTNSINFLSGKLIDKINE